MMDSNNDNMQRIDIDEAQQVSKMSGRLEPTKISASSTPSVLVRLGLEKVFSSSGTTEEQLKAALTDSAWSVRVAAVEALGKQRERVPLALLINALDDENGFVCAAAARALGEMPAPRQRHRCQ